MKTSHLDASGPLGDGSQVLGTRGSAFCVITCLIYFTSQKLSAMTEPICSDPRVSVRQTKRKAAPKTTPRSL